jgi:hypothetical protein
VNLRFSAFRSLCFLVLCGPLVGLAEADEAGAPALAAASKDDSGFRLGSNQKAADSGSPKSKEQSWFAQVFDQKLPIKFGLKVAETYSDNIFYQPQKTYDYRTEISPFLTLTLGTPIRLYPELNEETIDIKSNSGNLNFLQVTYRPTIALYAENPDLNTVDEFADALYAHQFAKFTLSIEQKYERLSQPTIEDNAAGTLIHRDIYTTTARTSYIYSDKLSSYGTANQIVRNYQSDLDTDSTEWNADYYFLYQFFPKLSLGLGPRIGFVDVDKAANQAYQGALVHLFYPASGKLSFMLAAGAELRETEHNAQADRVSPIFEAQAVYKPFDSMTIILDAGRHRIVSNTQVGQDYTANVVSIQVRQRFLQSVYLTLTGGYQDDEYSGADAPGPVRDDSYYFVRAGVEWTSKDWLAIDGSYQYSRDDSTDQAFTFDENKFVVSATVKY